MENRSMVVDPAEDPLLTPKDVARAFNISTDRLAHWRCSEPPMGPAYFKIGGQIRYRKSTVTKWLAAQEVVPERVA